MKLYDVTFDSRCQPINKLQNYWSGGSDSLLKVGQVIRVHTGRMSDESLMDPADRQGADWHGYAGKDNFVLNNRCGDTVTVSWQDAYGKTVSDSASYKPNVPEGAVLRRIGNELVPVGAAGRF